MRGPEILAPCDPEESASVAAPAERRRATAPVPAGARGVLRLCASARWFWGAMGVLAVLLVWGASTRQLVPDEAYYWVWSRHPALGYLDHPPMVAWLIWLSTHLLGTSELGVRAPAVLLALGTVPIVMRMASLAGGDPLTARLAGLLVLVGPITTAVASVTTPDGPVWFFGCAAVAAAVLAAERPAARAGGAWMLFGACLGLALLSKYTACLIGPAVFAALATSAGGRAHLFRPWFWLSPLVAATVFAPVLAWNAAHDWASFSFQLRHGLDPEGGEAMAALAGAAEYVGGQMAVWTPVLFLLSGAAFIAMCRGYRALRPGRQVLLWCAGATLAFFALSSLRHQPEINWPVLAYGPLAAVTALYVASNWDGRRVRWARAAAAVAVVCGLVLQFPEALTATGLPFSHAAQMFGYRRLGEELGRFHEGPVFANRYQDAAEAAFYMPGRPEVWSLNLGGSRGNAFDYFDGKPDLTMLPSATFLNCPEDEIGRWFTVRLRRECPTVVAGRTVRVDLVVTGTRHRPEP